MRNENASSQDSLPEVPQKLHYRCNSGKADKNLDWLPNNSQLETPTWNWPNSVFEVDNQTLDVYFIESLWIPERTLDKGQAKQSEFAC